MYALVAVDDDSKLEPVRVGVITLVTTSTTLDVVAELRRHAMLVDVVTSEVLHGAPEVPVYVVSVDAAVAGVLADKIVAWGAGSELRPGLIGLVENGGNKQLELLLAAGFDDVVASPISARELAGRVRAVHRRVHWKGISNGRLRFGELTLDLYGRSTDAFEALYAAPTLQEQLRGDDGSMIGRIMRTREALNRYAEQLRRLAA